MRWAMEGIFLKSVRQFESGFEFVKTKNLRRKTSILQWFQNLNDWPLWILKVRCERVLIHVTLDTNQPISALLWNNYHSKQASKLVTHVFINTRTSLTKDISFPRISRIQWLTTVNDIQTSDVKRTKLKTILQVESPSIRRLCSYGTAPSWMLLIPSLLWLSSWAQRKAWDCLDLSCTLVGKLGLEFHGKF